MQAMMAKLIRDEEGQGLVEYGLILALIAVMVIGALSLLGGQTEKTFTDIKDGLENPTGVG